MLAQPRGAVGILCLFRYSQWRYVPCGRVFSPHSLIVGLVGCCVVSQALEVTPDSSGTATSNGKTSPEQMKQQCRQMTARCLLLGDQEQVLLGEFAVERAQSPEVKQFAQSMVKSHNEFIAKLERFAPGAWTTDDLKKRAYAVQMEIQGGKGTLPAAADSDENASKATGAGSQDMARAMAAMQQKMAENCLAYTQAELAQVDKDKFDKAYIGQQIFNHVATLAKLRTIASHVSGELRPIIEAQEAAARAHLDEAKNICKQLDVKLMSQAREGTESR